MQSYRANTKAGRAWINTIVASATHVTRIDIDLITDSRTSEDVDRDLFTKIIAIWGKDVCLFETGDNEYVWVRGTTLGAEKYVIRTYAFDPTDLPVYPPVKKS